MRPGLTATKVGYKQCYVVQYFHELPLTIFPQIPLGIFTLLPTDSGGGGIGNKMLSFCSWFASHCQRDQKDHQQIVKIKGCSDNYS